MRRILVALPSKEEIAVELNGGWKVPEVKKCIIERATGLPPNCENTHGVYVRAGVPGVPDQYLDEDEIPALHMRPKDSLVLKEKPWDIVVHTSKRVRVDSSMSVAVVLPLLAEQFGIDGATVDRSTLSLWSDEVDTSNVAFGEQRGACSDCTCDCRQYRRPPANGASTDGRACGGACEYCGHYPAHHRKIAHLCGEVEEGKSSGNGYALSPSATLSEQLHSTPLHPLSLRYAAESGSAFPLMRQRSTDRPLSQIRFGMSNSSARKVELPSFGSASSASSSSSSSSSSASSSSASYSSGVRQSSILSELGIVPGASSTSNSTSPPLPVSPRGPGDSPAPIGGRSRFISVPQLSPRSGGSAVGHQPTTKLESGSSRSKIQRREPADDGDGDKAPKQPRKKAKKVTSPRPPNTGVPPSPRKKAKEDGMLRKIGKGIHLFQDDTSSKQANAFGVLLTDIVDKRTPIPPILLNLCDELRKRQAFDSEEGLFRLSGNQERINSLKEAANFGTDDEVQSILQEMSVHDLACTIKQFLMDLPEPLLTTRLHHRFLACGTLESNEALQLDYLRCLVVSLPRAHKNVLLFMCSFLANVIEHHEVTKMDATNMGIVFAPVFMRSSTHDMMSDALRCSAVASLLITSIDALQPQYLTNVEPLQEIHAPKGLLESQTTLKGEELFVFKQDEEQCYVEANGKFTTMSNFFVDAVRAMRDTGGSSKKSLRSITSSLKINK
eukprot:TRINITY_DN2397_c0_g1_i1.p1 TRINITY_DN2397_c0_g1~~TRINITY_DN2397_c0_g1_i1.p1  ORF type:complete len:725 (+),score=221.80 TRINITY_DN2397_c0_g1_i1:215-2389(+)